MGRIGTELELVRWRAGEKTLKARWFDGGAAWARWGMIVGPLVDLDPNGRHHSPRWPEAYQPRQLGDDGSQTNGAPTEEWMAGQSGNEKAADEESQEQPRLVQG